MSKDTFRKDKYEKEIARLETELQGLRSVNEDLAAKQKVQALELLAKEETFYKGLSAFLSQMYQQLASIQSEVLEHMSKLNSQLSGLTEKRSKKAIQEMARTMAALQITHIKDEELT